MIKVLATDLDGTLIPLPNNQQNAADLVHLADLLAQHSIELVFATGRHPAWMEDAIREFALPVPEFAICDVGTTILRQDDDSGFRPMTAYQNHLADLCQSCSADRVRELCGNVAGIRAQEEQKQGEFKISFYSAEQELAVICRSLEQVLQKNSADWNVIGSVDPFTRDGLIDVLPRGVSKSYAINWWSQHRGVHQQDVAYSGDSSNDLAALTAGYHGIVVSNAADDLREHLRSSAGTHSIFFSTHPATSGVLEGV